METYNQFAEIYDIFIKKIFPNLHKHYFDFVQNFLTNNNLRVKTILDTACGTGILMQSFKQKGYDVVGLDNSEIMLNTAKKKGLNVLKKDMINFEMNSKFDLILNFDSLNHILTYRDLCNFFVSVAKHLKKGGLFVFDIDSKEKIEKIAPNYPVFHYNLGKYKMNWKNSKEKDMWVADIEIIQENPPGKFSEKHKMKGYSSKQIETALKEANLEILKKIEDGVKKNSLLYISKKSDQ